MRPADNVLTRKQLNDFVNLIKEATLWQYQLDHKVEEMGKLQNRIQRLEDAITAHRDEDKETRSWIAKSLRSSSYDKEELINKGEFLIDEQELIDKIITLMIEDRGQLIPIDYYRNYKRTREELSLCNRHLQLLDQAETRCQQLLDKILAFVARVLPEGTRIDVGALLHHLKAMQDKPIPEILSGAVALINNLFEPLGKRYTLQTPERIKCLEIIETRLTELNDSAQKTFSGLFYRARIAEEKTYLTSLRRSLTAMPQLDEDCRVPDELLPPIYQARGKNREWDSFWFFGVGRFGLTNRQRNLLFCDKNPKSKSVITQFCALEESELGSRNKECGVSMDQAVSTRKLKI